jgi:hypothetical protein
MTYRTIRCVAFSGLLFITGCAGPTGPQPAPADPDQIKKAFAFERSASAEYAKNKDGGDFYVSLRVQNLRPIAPDKCLDKSFVAWVRKFFYQDAKRIALVLKVKGPDDIESDVRTVPLFETSQDEKTSSCLTDIQTERDITNKYVADRAKPFDIAATIETDSDPAVSGAQTTLAAANTILSYVAGSASLTKVVAGSALADAAHKVDDSLRDNFKHKSRQRVQFSLSPWPQGTGNDWSNHNDRAVFSVGDLSSTATGIVSDNTGQPNVAISLNYDISLFGGGPGHYFSADRILAQRVATANQADLNSILKNGIGGFTSNQGKAITTAEAITSFCSELRSGLTKYFTDDDALAARYAVLKMSTTYMVSETLQRAPGCFEETDAARLLQLNAAYTMPDLARTDRTNRQAFVDTRVRRVAKALAARTRDALAATTDTPDAFTVDVSMVRKSMPVRSDGKPWDTAKGNDAFDMLISAGRLRLGCAVAIPNQNLAIIPAVVLIDRTHKPVGALLEFGSGVPDGGTEAKTDLRSITLLPLGVVQRLYALPPWTEDTCQLL